MKDNYNNLYVGSRSKTRSQKRKTNMILNGLIGIILLLIIVVGAYTFLGSDSDQAGTDINETTDPGSSPDSDSDGSATQNPDDSTDEEDGSTDVPEDNESEDSSDNEGTGSEDEDQSEQSGDSSTDATESDNETEDSGEVTTEESDDPNVEKTIINSSWEPIGTSQEGEHAKNFDSNSQDWNEMQQAIATAIGQSQEGLTYWCVENGGPDSVIGTVTPKGDAGDPYRVYIKWVDNEGWMPVKVDSLVENDKQDSC